MPNASVLLVDDSLVARILTRAAVEAARPGWTILEAADGETALRLAAETVPDFVLMDVNMPGMNGLSAAACFRERFPTAALSLLTANIQDSVRDEAERMGIGYLEKPLRAEELARFLGSVGEKAP